MDEKSNVKENKFHFTMSGITDAAGTENFTVQFNGKVDETEEDVKLKIEEAKRLFDHVWKMGNKKALAVADKIMKDRTQDLPQQFN